MPTIVCLYFVGELCDFLYLYVRVWQSFELSGLVPNKLVVGGVRLLVGDLAVKMKGDIHSFKDMMT